MKHSIIWLVPAVAVAWACDDSSLTEPPPPANVDEAVASITASDLRGRVELMAHDSMRGRATPSPELEEVARYVAAEFHSSGLQSGAGGDYLQWWSLPVFSLVSHGPESGSDAMNTIGWLEGSDPSLRNEYVVIMAHMDHVGVRAPVGSDSIYNGADDNASGTAGLLELAEALAKLEPRPRRSLVFIAFGGEELGLWGSQYYSEFPAFPLASTVAAVNMDMIGRNWPDTVAVIRSPGSNIGLLAELTTGLHPELGMAVIDDRWGGDLFQRSDQYHFHNNGVPVLWYFSGTHEDYHQPSDEPHTLDYEKAARIVRLVFHTVLQLAESSEAPTRP
jgi:hypothetical protein